MWRFLWSYTAGLLTMLALDAAWLSLAGPRLYRPALQPILAESFSAAPAILFYLLYIVGLTTLTADRTVFRSASRGALYGLCAYGTYDLTNQSTLQHWPTYLTIFDLSWGTILSAVTASIVAATRLRFADRPRGSAAER